MVATASLTQLRAAEANPFQELLQRPARFDPDAYHAMNERDETLIRDELLHGSASDAFVYSFELQGKKVVGVSVIGARELAAQYKGIKTRIVATIEKTGALFIFRTFTPLSIQVQHIPDLADDGDFYECVMEVADIKTGNSIEVRKKESKVEKKRNGELYARPHYDVICESKAYRNGVLAVLPQSVIRDFRDKCLAGGKVSNEKTITQRRAGVLTFAARHGIKVEREALDELSFAELDGLGAAAGENLEAFKRAAAALGLIGGVDQSTGEIDPPAPAAPAQVTQAAPRPAPAPRQATPASVPTLPNRIAAAPDMATLDAIGKEVAAITNDDERSQLEDAWLARQEQLAAPAPAPTTSRRASRSTGTTAE